MSSVDVPNTPGSMIETARKQRGLSREDLAERTKIPPAMLAALEADEYHRLSGPLYARSFLRACAKELGLEVADVFAAYERHGGEPQRQPGAAAITPDPVRIRRVGLPWGRLAVGGALLAVAVVVAIRYAGPGDGDTAGTGNAGVPVAAGARDAATLPEAAPVTGAMGLAPESPPGDGDPIQAAAAAPTGGMPGLAFSDGLTWPLVACLRLEVPGDVACRRDGEPDYLPVSWPEGGSVPAVPVDGVVAGRPYADGAGFVIYWGGVQSLSLRLASASGATLAVNGEPWPLAAGPDGGPVVIEVPGDRAQHP
jgi:cytoskeleton protein RodZ